MSKDIQKACYNKNLKSNSVDTTVPVSKAFNHVQAFTDTFNSHWFLSFNTSKSLFIGMVLNTYLSTLTKYKSLNQLLLESERSEMKRCVSGHLIQPIFWIWYWLFFVSCSVCIQRTQKLIDTNFGRSFCSLIMWSYNCSHLRSHYDLRIEHQFPNFIFFPICKTNIYALDCINWL